VFIPPDLQRKISGTVSHILYLLLTTNDVTDMLVLRRIQSAIRLEENVLQSDAPFGIANGTAT
jgi:hypothetical protein